MKGYPIASSLSPNTEKDDIARARKMLFSPRLWQEGSSVPAVTNWFTQHYSSSSVFTFNSGRSAFYALLRAFDITNGDEVIIQSFTCVAVPEVILWVGATPVYADIDPATYNMDPSDVEKKITPKTKALVVQHTFGIPGDIKTLTSLARKHRLILIEDCAHALGATVKGKKVGTFGDGAFFSFGRDKIISSVFGGVAILNKHSTREATVKKLAEFYDSLPYPPQWWILQQLMHPLLFSIILPMYHVLSIGKLILILAQKMRLVSFPVVTAEYTGQRPSLFPKRLPNALAALAVGQLSKLYRYNVKRMLIAQKYGAVIDGAVYLRYPIKTLHKDSILKVAKKKGILLGTWYSHVIDPAGVDLKSVGYTKGSCPHAEEAARTIINLPTYPRMNTADVSLVTRILKDYHEHRAD